MTESWYLEEDEEAEALDRLDMVVWAVRVWGNKWRRRGVRKLKMWWHLQSFNPCSLRVKKGYFIFLLKFTESEH